MSIQDDGDVKTSLSTALALLVALLLGLHILAIISTCGSGFAVGFNDAVHRFGPGCDYFSIYAAGVKAQGGESVYSIGGHVEQVPYAYAFRYAPVVAYTLGLLLALLPPVPSYGLWLVACELALLRNVRLTLQDGAGRKRALIAAALWLLFSPFYLELYVGQFTFVTASLVFWAYLRWTQALPASTGNREQGTGNLLADLIWTAALWLKAMPVLFLPILLLRGRWKGALLALAGLALTSWLYFQRFPQDWAVFVSTNADPRPTWHAGNQGLMALLFALNGESTPRFLPARSVAIVVVALVLGLLFLQAWRAQRTSQADPHTHIPTHPTEPLLPLYAALSAAYLLLYKDVWEHHYVLLLPPLVLMVLRGWSPWIWLPAYLVAAIPTPFVLYDVPGIGYNEDPQRYWTPAISLLHHGWKPVAAMWLFGAVVVRSLVSGSEFLVSGWERRRRGLQWAGAGAFVAVFLVLGIPGVAWARRAIAEQRSATRDRAWGPDVFQRQRRPENCGPAALAAICRHYGVPATEDEIAGLAGIEGGGTSMLALQRAAVRKGLSAEGRQVSVEELADLPRPSILFFHSGTGRSSHFAVLTAVSEEPVTVEGGGRTTRRRSFYLADPSLGHRVLNTGILRRYWRGEVLLVGPGPR